MLAWADVYKVVAAMVPLYVALGLGYGSVRWWRIFTPEQCEAVNRLVAYFCIPFFTFEFTFHTDPFTMNYRVIAADAISKVVALLVLAAWAKCSSKGSYGCSITGFSLCTLTNTLVVGAPLLNAMYGQWAQDLVVQLSVVQFIAWFPLLLFMLELRKAGMGVATVATTSNIGGGGGGGGGGGCGVLSVEAQAPVNDVEGNTSEVASRPSFFSLMKTVWLKLVLNPNAVASVLGVTWAFIASRWHFGMPSIMEGSVLIMSKTGTGLAMFSLGLFMALQEKTIACGPCLTAFGMVLRFIAGPAAMAVGAIAVGLHGNVLRVAIIQAALPQSISSFIFAKEYGLHADVLSTAVIFGTLVSLPLIIAYCVALDFMS